MITPLMKDYFVMNKETADFLLQNLCGHNVSSDYTNAKYHSYPVVISQIVDNYGIIGWGKCSEILKKMKENERIKKMKENENRID